MWTPENRPLYERDKLRYPSDLTDAEWQHIGPLLPPAKRGGGKRRPQDRSPGRGDRPIRGRQGRPRAYLCRAGDREYPIVTRARTRARLPAHAAHRTALGLPPTCATSAARPSSANFRSIATIRTVSWQARSISADCKTAAARYMGLHLGTSAAQSDRTNDRNRAFRPALCAAPQVDQPQAPRRLQARRGSFVALAEQREEAGEELYRELLALVKDKSQSPSPL